MNIFEREKAELTIQLASINVNTKKRKCEDGDISTRPKKILIVE
jgi:hypothetical protein